MIQLKQHDQSNCTLNLKVSQLVRGRYHKDEGTVILLNNMSKTAQILPVSEFYKYPQAHHVIYFLQPQEVTKYLDALGKGMDLYESLSLLTEIIEV